MFSWFLGFIKFYDNSNLVSCLILKLFTAKNGKRAKLSKEFGFAKFYENFVNFVIIVLGMKQKYFFKPLKNYVPYNSSLLMFLGGKIGENSKKLRTAHFGQEAPK